MTKSTASSTASTRPHKHAAAPALAPAGTLYCHTCGRIISPRKPNRTANAKSNTPQKYCSDRCRREKPSVLETEIEATFVRLLDEAGGGKVLGCADVERVVFGLDSVEDAGGGREGKGVGLETGGRDRGIDIDDGDDDDDDEEGGGVPLPLPQLQPPSQQATLISTDTTTLGAREQGMRRARQREMVRQAARRGVAFGFLLRPGGVAEEGSIRRRRVEAVQGGRVVESSFAKGEWGVRWKERG